MQGIYEEIRTLGGEVLVVSFAPPEQVAEFVTNHPQPFPVVSDPNRDAYRFFGLERTTVGAMLRPGVLARYLGMVLRGWWPSRPARRDDLLQLGGDFLLDGEGIVHLARPSAEPTDRPTTTELLEALRQLN